MFLLSFVVHFNFFRAYYTRKNGIDKGFGLLFCFAVENQRIPDGFLHCLRDALSGNRIRAGLREQDRRRGIRNDDPSLPLYALD